MTILHLIETGGPGGAEQMLLRLADEYAERGFSQLVCLRKEGWLSGEVRRRSLDLEIMPLGTLPDLQWMRKMRALVRRCDVRAIHAHEFAMNVRSGILSRWLDVPAVATVHGKGYVDAKGSRRFAYRATARWTRMVAVSADIRTYLIDSVGVDPQRTIVIANGVDIDRYRFDPAGRREMRDRFKIAEGDLLLGSIGSYYPVKGHRYLIEAMKKVVAAHPGAKLLLVGQGSLEGDLRRQIADGALGQNVQVTGYIENTPALLSALDIFVMPSLSEGLPLALLEAAVAGRCIVASQTGGIPEVIADGQSGLLVPPGDAKALADALIRLASDAELRRALAAKAQAIVTQSWSIHRTADRYLELLADGGPTEPQRTGQPNL